MKVAHIQSQQIYKLERTKPPSIQRDTIECSTNSAWLCDRLLVNGICIKRELFSYEREESKRRSESMRLERREENENILYSANCASRARERVTRRSSEEFASPLWMLGLGWAHRRIGQMLCDVYHGDDQSVRADADGPNDSR